MSAYLKVLCGILMVVIAWSLINPVSGKNWLLEMLPIIVAFPVLIYFGKKYTISLTLAEVRRNFVL
jgi:uncharacterized membrane protein YjdF